MNKHKMWIGGKWCDAESGKTFATYNPATGEQIANIPLGDKKDVDKAVKAGQSAFAIWSKKSPAERTKILNQIASLIDSHIEELVDIEVRDHGTPLKVARMLIGGAPQMFEYMAQMSRALMGTTVPSDPESFFYLQREPRGVCALIVPWNVPLGGALIKLSTSLATGNTCVLKPPSVCSLGILKLAEILEKQDLPQGTINIVTGPGEAVGEALSAHPGIGMVSFTGSCEVGKRIMSVAGSTVKRVQLELGGKNPFIVLSDANVKPAVERAVQTSFWNTGMVCSAPGRYYIHESLYDEFVESFVAGAKQIVVGDPYDEKTDMGPVVSREHKNRVEKYIEIGAEEGARLIFKGEKPNAAPFDKGYFIEPVVFSDVKHNMRIAREEIFGPVACIIKFSDEDEVLKYANDTDMGLAASVWTRNTVKGIKFANEIQAGTVWINQHQKSGIEYPWGGYKESGFGKEKSFLGLEEFLQLKAISFNLTE